MLFANMQRNWMAWLGGVCIALAGIFLVGYGIERGYLGPAARIVAAVLAGLVLHAAAEYLRRRTRTPHPAFAAMAGGASITLYAAIFAALALYSLIGPGLTFVLLALVSVATMALATVHGPMLAAIGILGAFVVPLLVPNHGGTTLVNLGYSLTVALAALLLIRFVYRPWLWYGTLAGALVWWLVSLGHGDADGFRGFYLAALAYLMLALPSFDWLLRRQPQRGDPASEAIALTPAFSVQAELIAIVLIVLAEAFSIMHLGFTNVAPALALWSPLTIVVLLALRQRESLTLVPWILLVTQLGAWLLATLGGRFDRIELAGLALPLQSAFLAYALATAALFSLGVWLARRGRAYSHWHGSLVWLAPVLWLALAYLLVTDLSASWEWAVGTLAFGLLYITLGGRRLERDAADAGAIWPLLGGHIAYSLAAAMMFREATLTVALAAQLISLAWLMRRFALPALPWLIKTVLALVVVRLTFNPWLVTYPSGTHWSLWTYGGAVLCCFIATRLISDTRAIRKWLEAAMLHLLVLFLGAETRYWIYDGNIFVDDFSLTEVAIDAALWGALGLSYFNRGLHSAHLSRFYTLCSRVLLVLALASYGLALTAFNPLFGEPVSTTRLFNILLLAYGAPVVIALAAWLFYETRFRDFAAAIAGGGTFVFVTLEIRHLWHRALDLELGVLNGEMYTYSAAWLLMAVVTMTSASRLGSLYGRKAGMALLGLVIAKIFLYDMAGLEGLLRVASFMGLGLALLGLAWLYQRTSRELE
jgi:uncharacterized membrane protein